MNRLNSLKQRHARLEERLKSEMAHPSRDDQKIAELKHQKLLLKDEITELQTKEAA